MTEAITSKELVSELKAIKEDLTYIKEHMVDVDMILTLEEEARLEESIKEYKKGKAMPLEEFDKLEFDLRH